jgi:uncharacterized membrane protein YfcA
MPLGLGGLRLAVNLVYSLIIDAFSRLARTYCKMDTLLFTVLVFAGSAAAGFFGALTGLGGGVIIIPLLTLGFGIDIRYAAGASLVSVIATSSGAAAAYVKERFTNLRIGMFLEAATTMGAVSGALIAARVDTKVIAIIFGIVLLSSAYISFRRHGHGGEDAGLKPDPLAVRLGMDSTYPSEDGMRPYHVQNVPAGFGIMLVAGGISGLLGIGSGALKVMAMDQAMRIPFKVSTTTSNFMIGVTAAASAGVYLNRGYIDPGLVMPVMLGVVLGSTLGAHTLMKARAAKLRLLFIALMVALAFEMIYNGLTGRI